MSLEQISYIAQIVAAVAVVGSLIYVGLQLRQNTAQMERAEANATHAQQSAIRMAIVTNRDIAQLWLMGLSDDGELNSADELRFETLLEERVIAGWHIWDRVQRGLLTTVSSEGSASAIATFLSTRRGRAFWVNSRFRSGSAYAESPERAIARRSERSVTTSDPSG